LNKLVKLSSTTTYSNPLAVLLDIVKDELNQFKLAMLSCHNLEDSRFQVTGFCTEDNCPIFTAEEMLNTSPNFPILDGKFIEQWKQQAEPSIILCADCPDLFQGELKYFGVAIVIPIWVSGKISRWIVIVDYKIDNEQLDISKLSLLLNYALTNILRTEQKRQLDKARLWIDKELKEISRIQALLLPNDQVEIDGLSVAFKFKAFKDAGGDYFDIAQLPNASGNEKHIRWGGIIADVTGHGPSAAVEAAMLDAILRTYPGSKDGTPAAAASYVNKHFFTRRDRGKFITAKLFLYNSETSLLTYVSAGHPSGFIKRGKELIILDQSQGIPIGVVQDYVWEDHHIKLEEGDVLFIYTDVVLETRSPSNEEFGEQRLMDILKSAPSNPNDLVDLIEQELIQYSGGEDLKDDLTLLAIRLDR